MFSEDLNHEFKKHYVKDIIKTVIAFANTNGGKLYIGVDDNGQILGLDNPDNELLKLTNSVRDGISPDVTSFTSSKYEKYDDKIIIVYEVQKGTGCPYYNSSKGLRPEGVYVRQGASSVPASQSSILKMIKETDGDNYEDLRSLDQDLTFYALENEFKASEITLSMAQMKTLGIVGEDGLYTNLGLLLSDQCKHSVRAAVYEGISKYKFKDRYEFSGSLIKQVREVYAFIDRYNRTQSNTEGLKRIDLREYPESAIREVLQNSIVHKDYGFGSDTLISIFDDRIEVLTVGGLVKGLTKSDIMLGISLPRNKKLAGVFYRLKWIEAYGTGIIKINEAYQAYDVSPVIEISENAFKVTLPTVNSRRENLPTVKESLLSFSESNVLNMMSKFNHVKRSDIQDELNISQAMAIKTLKKLLDKNIIIKLGTGKNVIYKLENNLYKQ